MEEKIRPAFVYVTVIALIFGIIGIFIISGNFSGRVVSENVYSYSQEKVSLHNSPGDCWIIFDNNVYDVTMIISTSSGLEFLKSSCGDTVDSSIFNEDQKLILDNYKLGKLE